MDQEHQYVAYFYKNFQGRIALSVGYNQHFSEIFPFVYKGSDGKSIGMVALDVVSDNDQNTVHIFHISSFISKGGKGTEILKELCTQADKFQVCLSLSSIFMPNGRDEKMSRGQLESWYHKFGFKGQGHLKRKPKK